MQCVTTATRERGNEVQMFLFERMNKMIHTGNNGRGPGGPRLPSDRRRESDDRWLNIRSLDLAYSFGLLSALVKAWFSLWI